MKIIYLKILTGLTAMSMLLGREVHAEEWEETASAAETEAELRSAGADVLRLPQLGGRIELHALLRGLAQRGVNELLIESGATLAGSALQAGLVDELVVYVAPNLMGDAARGLVRMPGLEHLSELVELDYRDVRRIASDLRLTLTPRIQSMNGRGG